MRRADMTGLAQHMAWADATVWSAILKAPPASADAKLAETLHHVHLVQHLFRQAWAGDPFQLRDRADFADVRELARWGRQAHGEIATFVSGADTADFDREIRVPWAAHFEQRASRTAAPHTVGESILQVAMHTSHHRGQLCTRLRQLAVEPPTIDFIVWLWSGRPEADWSALEGSLQ
jgi:uncharacterized damage-inducible protein DinB